MATGRMTGGRAVSRILLIRTNTAYTEKWMAIDAEDIEARTLGSTQDEALADMVRLLLLRSTRGGVYITSVTEIDPATPIRDLGSVNVEHAQRPEDMPHYFQPHEGQSGRSIICRLCNEHEDAAVHLKPTPAADPGDENDYPF